MSVINKYFLTFALLVSLSYNTYSQDSVSVSKFPIKSSFNIDLLQVNAGVEYLLRKNLVGVVEIGPGFGYNSKGMEASGHLAFELRYYPWLNTRYMKGKEIKNFNGLYISEYSFFQYKKVLTSIPGFYLFQIPASIVVGYQVSFLKYLFLNSRIGYGIHYIRAFKQFQPGPVIDIQFGIFIKFPR
ncbi:MAG: hypothetical protein ISR55_02050 [Bacteroidetes bacterium]|nr:hypothetical protein [Bacteroidota bacterium]